MGCYLFRRTSLLSILFLYVYNGCGPCFYEILFCSRVICVAIYMVCCMPPPQNSSVALALGTFTEKHDGFTTCSIKPEWFHNMCSLRFQLVPTQNLSFQYVFNRFLRNPYVSLTFSIGFHATHVFSLRFQWIPTQNLCFPYVFHWFPFKTLVFLTFSK